jgi:hypothetical protein
VSAEAPGPRGTNKRLPLDTHFCLVSRLVGFLWGGLCPRPLSFLSFWAEPHPSPRTLPFLYPGQSELVEADQGRSFPAMP